MHARGWTNHEIQLAAEMRRLGHTYQEIGERLSRPPGSVKSVLIRNRLLPTVKEAAIKRETTKKLLGHTHAQKSTGNFVSPVNVPAFLIEERDRRANELRAGGGMQGEPPFSQSQLARPPRGAVGEPRERVTVYRLTYLDPATAD